MAIVSLILEIFCILLILFCVIFHIVNLIKDYAPIDFFETFLIFAVLLCILGYVIIQMIHTIQLL